MRGDRDLEHLSPYRIVNLLLRELAPGAGVSAPVLAPLLPWLEAFRIYAAHHPVDAAALTPAPVPDAAGRPIVTLHRIIPKPLTRAELRRTALASFTSTTYGTAESFWCAGAWVRDHRSLDPGMELAHTRLVLTIPPRAVGAFDLSKVSAYPGEDETTLWPGCVCRSGPTRLSRAQFFEIGTAATEQVLRAAAEGHDQATAGGWFHIDVSTQLTHEVAWSSIG